MKRQYNRKGGQALYSQSGKAIAIVLVDGQGRRYSQKTIAPEAHFLRKPPAIAYDAFTISQATKLGVKYHVVKERSTCRSWSAWHDQFLEHGFEFNRGFGRQIALALELWTEGNIPKPVVLMEATDKCKQGELFGEVA